MTIAHLAVCGALAVVLLAVAVFVCAWGSTILKLLDFRAALARRREPGPPGWRPDPVRVRRIQRALERRAAKADATRPGLT
jgi:hypothetical protein